MAEPIPGEPPMVAMPVIPSSPAPNGRRPGEYTGNTRRMDASKAPSARRGRARLALRLAREETGADADDLRARGPFLRRDLTAQLPQDRRFRLRRRGEPVPGGHLPRRGRLG